MSMTTPKPPPLLTREAVEQAPIPEICKLIVEYLSRQPAQPMTAKAVGAGLGTAHNRVIEAAQLLRTKGLLVAVPDLNVLSLPVPVRNAYNPPVKKGAAA